VIASADGTIISDYFIAELAPTAACDMHVDGTYVSRPPFITTDHRWSRQGRSGKKA
jgi:hypothetical protein